jgi:protein phosphatase
MDSAGISDVGRKRKGNEDALFLDDALCFYVVADGMGGHAAGEVASRIVVDTMRDFVRQFAAGPSGATQLPKTVPQLSTTANLLLNAVHLANRAVHQKAQSNVSYRGMGSTVSAVMFGKDRMSVVNVGDSPVYLIGDGVIQVVSTPHTMMDEYKELAPEATRKVGNHLRHVLTRAVGLGKRVEPDARDATLTGGETVVICSDGLSDKVSEAEILSVVSDHPPEAAAKTLVAMANDRGGDDNITVVVVRRDTAGSRSRQSARKLSSPQKSAASRRIAVDYDTEDASHRTYVSEIRPDGVFLKTTEAVSVGEEIWLTFTPEQGGGSLMVSGRAASCSSSGIDVRFERLTPVQQKWIASLSEK